MSEQPFAHGTILITAKDLIALRDDNASLRAENKALGEALAKVNSGLAKIVTSQPLALGGDVANRIEYEVRIPLIAALERHRANLAKSGAPGAGKEETNQERVKRLELERFYEEGPDKNEEGDK